MRFRRLILLSLPGLAVLAACQPVTGDANDNSPPAISFRIANQVVSSPQALQSLPAEGLTVVAADPGGMTSLRVTNIVVFDCVAVGRRENPERAADRHPGHRVLHPDAHVPVADVRRVLA